VTLEARALNLNHFWGTPCKKN